MAQFRIMVVAFLTISSTFSVNAQTASIPSCQSLTGMTNISATLLAGQWYEEFRAPGKDISCVYINVTAVNNEAQLNVTVKYSASKVGLLMNQFASAIVGIDEVNSNSGFSIKYNNSDTVTTFKIINTDYTSNAVLCGYTNVSDPSTSFGIIATRQQIVNVTWLMQLKGEASQKLPVFDTPLAANITQSLKCTSSAASPVPALAILFATFYALVKLVQ